MTKKNQNLPKSIYLCLALSLCTFLFIVSCKKNNSTDTVLPANSTFKLTSSAVVNGVLLDAFKCEKKVNKIENSIPLAWSGAPTNAKSFAITLITT